MGRGKYKHAHSQILDLAHHARLELHRHSLQLASSCSDESMDYSIDQEAVDTSGPGFVGIQFCQEWYDSGGGRIASNEGASVIYYSPATTCCTRGKTRQTSNYSML